MKARLKRWRDTQKAILRAIRKVVYFFIAAGMLYFAITWLYPALLKIDYYPKIDTVEADAYYDLLSSHAKPAQDLVLDMGIREDEPLQAAIDKLKGVMGLGDYTIWFAHHDKETPPAYIKELGYGDMGILISNKVKERREELNLLVHELGHIYVNRLDKTIFGKCDQEKLVDCSGIFLGLGVLTLNGLTDDFALLPEGGYETKKKFFGYLKPEQFGYLLARYCRDHGIAENAVRPFLTPAGRKYFKTGSGYLKKRGYAPKGAAGSSFGIYWRPGASSFTRISLREEVR